MVFCTFFMLHAADTPDGKQQGILLIPLLWFLPVTLIFVDLAIKCFRGMGTSSLRIYRIPPSSRWKRSPVLPELLYSRKTASGRVLLPREQDQTLHARLNWFIFVTGLVIVAPFLPLLLVPAWARKEPVNGSPVVPIIMWTIAAVVGPAGLIVNWLKLRTGIRISIAREPVSAGDTVLVSLSCRTKAKRLRRVVLRVLCCETLRRYKGRGASPCIARQREIYHRLLVDQSDVIVRRDGPVLGANMTVPADLMHSIQLKTLGGNLSIDWIIEATVEVAEGRREQSRCIFRVIPSGMSGE